jgi:ATP-dependent Lhr-like helicase
MHTASRRRFPFWLGEAPGRSDGAVRGRLAAAQEFERGCEPGVRLPREWLTEDRRHRRGRALQIVAVSCRGRAALGCLPTLQTVVFERFFDESGGMQLIIHSPYGSRVNRAWGLSLAQALLPHIQLRIAGGGDRRSHRAVADARAQLRAGRGGALSAHSNTVRQVLVQALCAAPMFQVRWRWDAGIALALPRFRGGKKGSAAIRAHERRGSARSVFPDQVACAENLPGEIEVPDHPLVKQTIRDCLEEAMDIDAFEALLRGSRAAPFVVARDLTEPSPLALEA